MSRVWGSALALLVVVISPPVPRVEAQYPVPRVVDRAPDPVDGARAFEAVEVAYRLFAAERWAEAVDAFDSAARENRGSLPAEALLRWGVAASEGGRPLTAYLRLSQFLGDQPAAPERDDAVARAARAREALLSDAAQFSRLSIAVERRADDGSVTERQLVRVAARAGDVSIEGIGDRAGDGRRWRRADEIPTTPYIALLRRLLDAPAAFADVPAQPGGLTVAPGATVAIRLAIGDEDRRLQAFGGEPYRRLRAVADAVFLFAPPVRSMTYPDAAPAGRPSPAPRPAKKRR